MNIGQLQNQQMGASLRGGAFSRDLTDMDLSTHMAPVKASGGLIVNFFYKKVQCKARNAETNGKIENRLCVSKQPKGDRSTVAVRYISEEQAQAQFPREFAMFKQYEQVPTDGTPLDELPGITLSQVAMLVINGIRSVEDLVEISEDQLNGLGREVIKARTIAVEWVAKKQGAASTIDNADDLAKLQIENQTFAERLRVLEESNRTLAAQNEALKNMGGAPQTVAQMPGQATADGNAMPVESQEDDLPTELSEMDDPLAQGPDFADGNDDLGGSDPDPLAGGDEG